MSRRDSLVVAAICGKQKFQIWYEDGMEDAAIQVICRWASSTEIALPPKMATVMARRVREQARPTPPQEDSAPRF